MEGFPNALPNALMEGALRPNAAKAPRIPQTSDPLKAQRAAQDFESFFLSYMLESLFTGIETAAPFGGGPSEKVYRSLMLEEYGKIMSHRGSVGIADIVQREILKLQEVDG
jgi:Rod binding domain-containing protein